MKDDKPSSCSVIKTCPRCGYPIEGMVVICPRCREPIEGGCSGSCSSCGESPKKSNRLLGIFKK